MSTFAEQVATGAAFLDEHDPDWWRADVERAIDLDDLTMEKTDRCILGQRCPLDALAEAAGVDDPSELSFVDMGEAYWVNAARLGGGFKNRSLLAEWAVEHGFNAYLDFDGLTAEWKRVITERRAAQ